MTDERPLDSEVPPSAEEPGAHDLRQLLRGALNANDLAPREMLPGVQRKLRERSRGKFYADGWSTAKHPPITTYLITSLFMLAVVGATYAVLAYLSGEAVVIENVPAPVQLIPAPRPSASLTPSPSAPPTPSVSPTQSPSASPR